MVWNPPTDDNGPDPGGGSSLFSITGAVGDVPRPGEKKDASDGTLSMAERRPVIDSVGQPDARADTTDASDTDSGASGSKVGLLMLVVVVVGLAATNGGW